MNRKSVPCPHCGYMVDSYMGVAMKDDPRRPKPHPGAISICIKCAGLAVFTESMGQRKMTYLEEIGLDAETKKMLLISRSQVRAVNRTKGAG